MCIEKFFADDGEAVMIAQIFPDKDDKGIELFSTSSETAFSDLSLANEINMEIKSQEEYS